MTICLSFVGKTPNYLEDNVKQIRYFTNDNIYIILSDTQSSIVDKLKVLPNIYIIEYNDVKSNMFDELMIKCQHKFKIITGLNDRKEIFIRSFERFYILYELMSKQNLKNVWFLELDNLIYDDPSNWLKPLEQYDMAYMIDNDDRGASGISFFRSYDTMYKLLNHFTEYIQTSNDEYINEMKALYTFYKECKDSRLYIFPTHWDKDLQEYSENYNHYNTIFDSSSIGIYLFGLDPFHTSGKVRKNCKNPWSKIDYTKNNFKWMKDEKNRNIPYIQKGEDWIRINNLHIHSKILSEAVSK